MKVDINIIRNSTLLPFLVEQYYSKDLKWKNNLNYFPQEGILKIHIYSITTTNKLVKM